VKTTSYSESRARYAETLDSVVNDWEEVVITRAGHERVVIVSLDDYQSLKEMAYLVRSPENARRLLASIDRLESGLGTPTISSSEAGLGRARLGGLPVVAGAGPQGAAPDQRAHPGHRRQRHEGIGKPEPLRHAFQGYWSRQLTDEHRLVYRVVENETRIAACRYHYSR